MWPWLADFGAFVFGTRYRQPPTAPGAATVVGPGAPGPGATPHADPTFLSGADWQPHVEDGPHVGSTWDTFARGEGVEAFRVPREVMLNLGNLAGLSTVDGVHQTDHDLFLPPLRPAITGAQPRAMSGGRNRVSSNSELQSHEMIPAVFVPFGRGDT